MTLFKEIHQKPLEYIFLLIIFLTAAILFIIFRFDSHFQRNIVYGTSGLYFLWSLYHHYLRGDLHLSIIIEYLVFILLAIVITSTTLF
jgi:hypothetical protein